LVPFTSWSCISADASLAVAIEAIIAYLFVRGAAPLNYAGVVSMAQETQSSWLKPITGVVIGAAALDLIKAYVEKAGGLDAVVKNFRDGGFKRQVDSWISTAKNEPISSVDWPGDWHRQIEKASRKRRHRRHQGSRPSRRVIANRDRQSDTRRQVAVEG
jgi:hypothetical protein